MARERLSTKEALVLSLIGTGAMYGLELIRESNGSLHRALVYVLLHRMEDKGLITSRLEDGPPSRAGRKRRLYSASAMGRTALEEHEPQDETRGTLGTLAGVRVHLGQHWPAIAVGLLGLALDDHMLGPFFWAMLVGFGLGHIQVWTLDPPVEG